MNVLENTQKKMRGTFILSRLMYNDDMDLRVEVSEHQIPILEDQRNDKNIFLMN